MSKERFTIEHFGEFDDVESFIYDNKTQRRILKSYNYGYNDLMEMLDFINQQDHQIAVLKRALKSACKRYWDDCGMEDCPYGENASFDANNKKCQDCSDNSGMSVNKDGCCWVDFFNFQAENEIKKEKE